MLVHHHVVCLSLSLVNIKRYNSETATIYIRCGCHCSISEWQNHKTSGETRTKY